MNSGDLKVAARGEREIVMTRTFHAPRSLVFQTFTNPDYVRQWLLGPDGWSMPVCEIDLRVGGKYRYVWREDQSGREMGVSGVFQEVSPPERVVHSEKFDQAWYAGECLITTIMTEHAGKTTVTLTLLYNSANTRDAVLKSPMERGVTASYNRLETLLASAASRRVAG